MKRTNLLPFIVAPLVLSILSATGCSGGAEETDAATTGVTTVTTSSAGGGGASGTTVGTGGFGGAGGLGGAGGAGGEACIVQGFNLLDLTPTYDPPGLPFSGADASVDPQAAVASVPGSPIHHWAFQPLFGSNNSTSVTLELTCHDNNSSDLKLSVVRARFQSGDWKFQSEGMEAGCGQSVTFTINKPPGPEPDYFYRVAYDAGAAPQSVAYTIGTASTYMGPAGDCVGPDVVIEPPGDDLPSEGEALSTQAGTITAPFGNTHDFMSDPALVAPGPTSETVSASISCNSPHLELRIATVGDNGQLRFANRSNSTDKTLDCGESGSFNISLMNGQAHWFALTTVKETYDYVTDGAIAVPYTVTVQ